LEPPILPHLYIPFPLWILPFSHISTYPFHFGSSHSPTSVHTLSTLDPPILPHLYLPFPLWIIPFSHICTYPFHFGSSYSSTSLPTVSTLYPMGGSQVETVCTDVGEWADRTRKR
jgi:hypothetical protein